MSTTNLVMVTCSRCGRTFAAVSAKGVCGEWRCRPSPNGQFVSAR